MNGVPMKFDYSKTINEQLPTFDYYKDRYCSYELELLKDRKEIERLKEENEFLKLSNPEMNLEHFRVVKENKRKMDNLRQVNKRLNNIIKEQGLEDKPNYYVKGLEGSLKEYQGEVERLNNKLKDIKSQLDYLETYSSKEDVFKDMKRRLDRIENIVNRK